MALTVGSHADVAIPNVLIEDHNPDQSWVLVRLPDDGGNPVEYWMPAADVRIVFKPILPAGWPPLEGDLWTVPNVTPTAWVIKASDNNLYFVTPDNILAVYGGNTTLPATTDQALAQYGNALTLLYRKA